MCCDSWCHKESDTTERLIWSENHCRWWLQPWNYNTLTAWKESYDQSRQHIKKQRHYFDNKVCLVKPMVFPLVMNGCESWTIKKAERRRIDAGDTWLSAHSGYAQRNFKLLSDQIRSDQSLSGVRLFATPWITARQTSLSITNSQSSLKLMSIESLMPSSHLILCRPLLLLPPIPPSIRVFSNESTLRMRWPKYWSFSFICFNGW